MSELPEPARAFADGDVDLLPAALDEPAQEALLALLVARNDAARLTRLAEGADKGLGKRARRALHLLRTRGIAVPKPAPRAYRPKGPFAAVGVAAEPSMMSLIDGQGERIVWLVRPSVDGGYDVFQAELSEIRGLVGFQTVTVSKKEWRRYRDDVLASVLFVGQVTESHVRELIEAAYQRTIAEGRVVPEEFARARIAMGHYEPETRHPSLELAPPLPLGEVRGELGRLLELPELRRWGPPEEALPQLDLEAGNVATSKLIIEPSQRQAQLAAAVERIADLALDAAYRQRLALRLRETALLLAVRAQPRQARLASTAAELTLDASVAAHDNPFVMALFQKTVKAEAPPSR